MADVDYKQRVTLWAARVLDTSIENVTNVETDWVGLCSTCEYSRGWITVTLADGRTFKGESTFGLFLNDIIELDLNPDGTLTGYARGELFDLVAQP